MLADVAMAKNILLEAKIDSLQTILLLLLARAGVDTINGVSFKEIMPRLMRDRIQEKLIALETTNPEVAAHLQHILDEVARASGTPPPSEG
jgi:hypothetical protein